MKHELRGGGRAAFVGARPGRAPAEDDLRRFCRERMAPYRVPVRFTLVEALPRNEAGKLLRSALAERARSGGSAGG